MTTLPSHQSHVLGFPRIGARRELKYAVESYWRGELTEAELQQVGATLRQQQWQWQTEAGLSMVTVGDFSFYDHVLDTSLRFGVIPARHQHSADASTFEQQFYIARGQSQHSCCQTSAAEMTKWFNTNYHYLVPEFHENQPFSLHSSTLLAEVSQAQQAGFQVKVVLLGPLSFLYLGRMPTGGDKLALLPALLNQYQQLLQQLANADVSVVQIDEPILGLELSASWQQAFQWAYRELKQQKLTLLLASYFTSINHQWSWLTQLPISGLHLDLTEAARDNYQLLAHWPEQWICSAGVVNGRNIWRTDLHACYQQLIATANALGPRLWLASSCSLLHVPVDLAREQRLPAALRDTLAFAKQKCAEVAQLANALSTKNPALLPDLPKKNAQSSASSSSPLAARIEHELQSPAGRSQDRVSRIALQQHHWRLPILPTTTIGSFPQTSDIRQLRLALKAGRLSAQAYQQAIEQQIQLAIHEQEALGLDVLVHGEAERNDMVEYFAEHLAGFTFSEFGWVQSYGSRCVKPPILFDDVSRPKNMTVDWTCYAQSLTKKPVKGMLTGPVTILNWSFVREDLPRSTVALQLALAISDEVLALEQAGIGIIQIDEPALREGLPLKQSEQASYLSWAVDAFKRCSRQVQPQTQIHTHMCYSQFNDIMPAIDALDADVISIETSRSGMTLLQAFEAYDYQGHIGPGVYDIHSPNTPNVEAIKHLLQQASRKLDWRQLWVNPDCGLKTRGWAETRAALQVMVTACQQLRLTLTP